MTNVIAGPGHRHLLEAAAVVQTGHVAWLEDPTMPTDLDPFLRNLADPWRLRWHRP
jgi:hypothetical protein